MRVKRREKKRAEILDDFLGDMLKVSISKNFPGFFYRSRSHVIVILLLTKANYIKEEISFEEMCKYIPKHISSRSTIKTILDHGNKYGYFIKTNSNKDKRKKIYIPTKETIQFMNEWIKRNSEIFIKYKLNN
tara:strand:- start:1501 stop:1896 length:396 start_codon:yes stop_codon:yes gene_type:complete